MEFEPRNGVKNKKPGENLYSRENEQIWEIPVVYVTNLFPWQLGRINGKGNVLKHGRYIELGMPSFNIGVEILTSFDWVAFLISCSDTDGLFCGSLYGRI